MSTPHLPLGDGAEFETIARWLRHWGTAAAGIGDDAAVLPPSAHPLVVSTDAFVEDVHFRRAWLTPAEVGWRATMAALSDLAAMGAAPIGVLLAITVPAAWRGDVDGIMAGAGEACRTAGTVIVGGDTSAGGTLALVVTVLGTCARPLRRDGACAGDTLYVSGRLGGPLAALTAWTRGDTPSPADRARFAHPEARMALGQWAVRHGATAAVDLSDGLASDVRHLARASGVTVTIDADRLPLMPGCEVRQGLASGEEYELLLTGPAGLDALAAAEGMVPLTAIGSVAPPSDRGGGELLVLVDGRRVDPPPGYDHLSAS